MKKPARDRVRAGPVFDMADELSPRPVAWVTVREYAHQVRPDRKPDDRLDFAETLYWSAATRTDEKGEAVVRFGTSDSVTSFRVAANGYTAAGALGTASAKLESVRPFYAEPKLPLEVTEGDVVRLPVALVNGTREPLSTVSLALDTRADLRFTQPQGLSLGADQRVRRVVELKGRLQRTDPQSPEYATVFADLLALEEVRRSLRQDAMEMEP